MPKCSATKANGTPCERLIDTSAILCYSHDVERAEERRTNAALAAAAKRKAPLGELGEVKLQLRSLADNVIEGSIDKGSASVAAQVLGVYIRAVEQERKVREQDELVARLDALEQATQSQGRRGPWGA